MPISIPRSRALINATFPCSCWPTSARLPAEIKQRVEEWVKKGGVLVRFAGPRLEKGGDDLLPVALRPAAAR